MVTRYQLVGDGMWPLDPKGPVVLALFPIQELMRSSQSLNNSSGEKRELSQVSLEYASSTAEVIGAKNVR